MTRPPSATMSAACSPDTQDTYAHARHTEPAHITHVPSSFHDPTASSRLVGCVRSRAIAPPSCAQVPRSNEKHGVSHYGGLSPDKPYVPMAQTGHEGYKVSAPGQPIGQAGEKDVELNMIPGYQGFIPKMRDAFGTSVYTKGR